MPGVILTSQREQLGRSHQATVGRQRERMIQEGMRIFEGFVLANQQWSPVVEGHSVGVEMSKIRGSPIGHLLDDHLADKQPQP